jgi:regulator of sirC expression with transglutaminase-like and TPR domain
VTSDPTDRLAALLAGTAPMALDEAMVLIAVHADPQIDVAEELARLDELAAGVEDDSAEGVRSHLYDELGFCGDGDTYYSPSNSLLPSVVDRRTGIPITLAVVAIEVGRRVGVGLEGIAMPGHFLLRPSGDPGRFLDPFDGHGWIDAAACQELFHRTVAGMPWDDRYLDLVSTPRNTLARVLNNLAGAYRREARRADLVWVLGLQLLVSGDHQRVRRELGVLLGSLGRYEEGAEVLAASPDPADHRSAAMLRAQLN